MHKVLQNLSLYKGGKDSRIKAFWQNMSQEVIDRKYPWLNNCNIKNAILGESDDYGLVWFSGTLTEGTWKNGLWVSGLMENAVWENGCWWNGVAKNVEWLNGEWQNGYFLNGKGPDNRQVPPTPQVQRISGTMWGGDGYQASPYLLFRM